MENDNRILEELKEMQIQVAYLADMVKEDRPKYETQNLEKLFDAMAKAQGEMESAKQDNKNPFFGSNYADLSSVVKASRPYLSKHGVSVMQRLLPDEKGQMYMHTRVCHSSGQWMESKMPVNPQKQDIQSVGSYITYLRRYNYAAAVGVVTGEDDDGEAVMKSERRKEIESKKEDVITKAQVQILGAEIEGMPEVLDKILEGLKIKVLSDMPAKEFSRVLNHVKTLKRAKEK